MSRHRRRWRQRQGQVDPSRLVFIDETWTKTNMTRLHGWAPKGRRLIDKVPHGHWKTATFLAALRNDRIEAPCLFDGPINGERFLAYVEQFLAPTLKRDDIVILDNLGSHKGKAVRRRQSCWRAPPLPSKILAGPQSDRAALLEGEDARAKGRAALARRRLRRLGGSPELRMRKLLHELRLCA